MQARKAKSLIEVLIVVAILSTLMGLMLPAIQKARESSLRIQNLNKLKQITLATHLIESQQGLIPGVFFIPKSQGGIEVKANLHREIIGVLFPFYSGELDTFFWNPLDPSLFNRVDPDDPFNTRGLTCNNLTSHCSSYALNAQIGARKEFQLTNDIPDGTSQTILFSERYAYRCNGIIFATTQVYSRSNYHGFRRCAFAESPIWDEDSDMETEEDHDVYPITNSNTLVTKPSRDNQTFQNRPKVGRYHFLQSYPKDDCDPRRVQSSQRSGLAVSFADGSTRLIHPNVHPNLFWAAVTPAGNEIHHLD